MMLKPENSELHASALTLHTLRAAQHASLEEGRRALEILDRLGVGDTVVKKGVGWNVGRTFVRKDEVYQFNLVPDSGHKRPGMINLQQYYLEEDLVTRAQALDRLKSEFMTTAAHELRTPMNAVLGAADLLGRTDLTEAQKELLDMLADGGSVLMHVLNDVLDLAKIEAGKLSIDPTNTDLHDFVRRCGALWAPRAEDRGLDFRIRIAPETPQFVSLDATRVGQIIFNLVSNALKFTEVGEVGLDLSGETTPEGDVRLSLSVSDTGMGMSPDIQSRLFNAFQQADANADLALTVSTTA
mgnify:CR=1 FL=1